MIPQAVSFSASELTNFLPPLTLWMISIVPPIPIQAPRGARAHDSQTGRDAVKSACTGQHSAKKGKGPESFG